MESKNTEKAEKVKVTQTEEIIEETQREAILNRPQNLTGAIGLVQKEKFCIGSDKIAYETQTIVPALLKLFMEVLDNPIDVAIKGGCDKIEIEVDSISIKVSDNGYGVNTGLADDKESYLYKAFFKYHTSSNYQDKKGKGQKGVNGVGIKLCSTLSDVFTVISYDKNGGRKITSTNNNLNHTEKKLRKRKITGVQCYFEPTLSIFDCKEIDSEHIKAMYEYSLMQSLTYPNISFKFNGKSLKMKPRHFLKLLNENLVIQELPDYFVAIVPNETESFNSLCYVNGLNTVRGSHIDYLLENIVKRLTIKAQKKYKNIKRENIKQRLTLILVAKNMLNISWGGQTKEEIVNSKADMREYFKDFDFISFTNKIFNKKEIMNPILFYYQGLEEANKKKKLAEMDKKTRKKPKNDKFLEPIGNWDNIFLCEGDSASASISSILGRENKGYFAMFGVPPNPYDLKSDDILKSVKLKTLQDVLGIEYSKNIQNNLHFKNIIITTDADLPGFHIRGLLLALFYKFGKNLFEEGRIKILRTPLFVVNMRTKNDNLGVDTIVDWFYSFEEKAEFQRTHKDNKNLKFQYKKGLSSWNKNELLYIIEEDGFEEMLETITLSDSSISNLENPEVQNIMYNWFSNDAEKQRKDMLDNFDFNILNT